MREIIRTKLLRFMKSYSMMQSNGERLNYPHQWRFILIYTKVRCLSKALESDIEVLDCFKSKVTTNIPKFDSDDEKLYYLKR
jgi:hypothetical protein